ncbi:50S ribosomal protein L7/L12 [Candidatus Synchoanobacter obligatus]|uniref:Large ribosomal subunit protein bL12 n=1 Tax=Candidatus Synchoanobacter obligatus TaxID=2919597 RepID=A0ABT1L6G6_9GAMM|nr:50S ribosomal protein L7/L12 [Candidatus Synchoanobacter obligatus]MCP8352478.1 50S ribosomal protein L7/L12 [Candidatus Synchoanobacter obligatus]
MSEKVKVDDLLNSIDSLTVAQLVELVEAIKEKYGVDPQPAAVAVAAAPAGGEAAAEQTEFNLVLKGAGSSKIAVIKVVKEALGLGIKDAKEKVDSAPVALLEGADKAKAEELAAQLKEAGADVSVE